MSALLQLSAFLLGIALPHWIIERDERKLTGIQRGRAWPNSSHWAAIIAFSWLAVPVHFIRTRRTWRGVGLGLAALTGGLTLQLFILWGLGLFES